jgi:RNA polymerase sigma-70 factor (sigma-E family)
MEWLSGATARREFELFVFESTPDLMRTGYLLTWNLAEAEDVVQETLLRTAKKWPTIAKMDHPLAYVRRILVNVVLRGSTRRARTGAELDSTSLDQPEAWEDARVERELLAIDARSELLWMLSALPTRQRAVVVLRYFEDLSESEIAEQLGWPVGTVKSTSARALHQLQRAFEESGTEKVELPHERVPSQEGAFDDHAT